jgi:hypothetical protein
MTFMALHSNAPSGGLIERSSRILVSCARNPTATAAVEVRALSVFRNPPVDWSEGRSRRALMSNIDPWEKAADCERARKSAADPDRRTLLANLRDLWIALGSQCEVMSSDEMAQEAEAIGRLHADLYAAGNRRLH